MSETRMTPYIQGFNAGVDCVLTEIERLEKIGPISLDQLLKHLDPQRDQKTPQKPEKARSRAIDGWIGLDLKVVPDKWMGNRVFIAGAKWSAKQLKGKNNASK